MSVAHLLPPQQVLDTYFLETRAKLLEIAATLDRLDRANAAYPADAIRADDPRLTFVRRALDILKSPTPASDAPSRAEALQRLYSLE